MSKLKTLKDILEQNGIDYEEGDWGEPLVDLKQEAIKRYKYWMKIVSAPFDEKNMVNHMNIYGRLAEIKEFYNLTEEDLK